MFYAADPGPDYELAWPRDLFVSEATALLASRSRGWISGWIKAAELLLREAFAGYTPAEDLWTVRWSDIPPELLNAEDSPDGDDLPRAFLFQLLSCASRLPGPVVTTPYWNARKAPDATGGLTGDQAAARLQREWWHMVEDLRARGYLTRVAPECADTPARASLALLNLELEKRLGVADLWPMSDEGWRPDDFYSLVEAVHDLVARPRERMWHMGDDWHYLALAPAPARALYRWRVDQLLARYGVGLQLAADGEDTGRLVHTAGDDRDALVQRVLTTDTGTQDERVHAIAVFRARTAGVPEKRTAIVTLAGLLEQRKDLLKTKLLSKDEGALFQIANKFDLRHRRADQQGDYDQVFLDWVFWWYLATVELTDRLLARQDDTP